MHKRLFGLLVSAGIAFAACSGSATPSPSSASQAPTQAPPSATPVPTSPPLDLGKTDYYTKRTAPTATTPGGTLVMAEWQTVATINRYYVQANADVEAQAPSFDGLLTLGYDDGLRARPGLEHPDRRQWRRHDQRRRHGRHLEPQEGCDVVGRFADHLRRRPGDPGRGSWTRPRAAWPRARPATRTSPRSTAARVSDCVMHFSKTYSAYLLLFGAVLPKAYITTVPVKDAPTKLYPLSNPKVGDPVERPLHPDRHQAGRADHLRAEPELEDDRLRPGYVDEPRAVSRQARLPVLRRCSPGMIAGYRNGQIDVAMDLVRLRHRFGQGHPG